MKIKLDFVTNSSSTTFVFEASEKVLRKDIEPHMRFYYAEVFRCFNNKKSLVQFVEAGYGDWVSKARGEPATFYKMDPTCYREACKILNCGKFAIYASVDRNDFERVEKFLDLVEDTGARLKVRSGD